MARGARCHLIGRSESFPFHTFTRAAATALGRAFSRFWAAWASLGLPPRRQVGLEVMARRTGRPHPLALVIAGHEGKQYLVSMLGECEWVKNVRTQGEAYLNSGRRRRARFEEVPVEGRAPIIKEYLLSHPGHGRTSGLARRRRWQTAGGWHRTTLSSGSCIRTRRLGATRTNAVAGSEVGAIAPAAIGSSSRRRCRIASRRMQESDDTEQ